MTPHDPESEPRPSGADPASGAGSDSGGRAPSDPLKSPEATPGNGAESAGGSSAGSSAPSSAGPPLDADGDGLPDGEWVASQRKDANAMGVGLQFGLVVGVFAFAGLKADEHFGTSPWLLLASVALAFVGSTISLLKRFA